MIPSKEISDELISTTNKRKASEGVTKTTEAKLIQALNLIFKEEYDDKDYVQNFKTAIDIVTKEIDALRQAANPVVTNDIPNEASTPYEMRKEANSVVTNDVPNEASTPYEIRMTISYIVYHAMELAMDKVHRKNMNGKKGKLSAVDVFNELGKADRMVNQAKILKRLKLGHNTFTKWGIRPKQYYHVTHYKQFKSPIRYRGAKIDDYGYAIRQLVYQAGEYRAFADIFGGGGNASLAVIKIDTSEYYYNELDKMVVNTVTVLKDSELCKSLIKLFREFSKEVQGKGESQFLKGYLPVNATQQAINNAYIKSGKNATIGYIKDVESTPINVTKADKEKFIKEYNTKLRTDGYSTYCTINGRQYKLSNLQCEKPDGTPDISKFSNPVIQLVARMYGVRGVGYHKVNEEKIAAGTLVQGYDFIHYKMLSYWYLFREMYDSCKNNTKIIQSDDDKVFYAFAHIFLRYLAYQGNDESNTVILQAEGYDKVSKSNNNISHDKPNWRTIETFLGVPTWNNVNSRFKDDECIGVFPIDEIRIFHKCFKRVQVENQDFRKFIDSFNPNSASDPKYEYKPKADIDESPVIFYSDSPYLRTKGYDMGFSVNDMHDLITKLIGSRQRFIFSCRACKSKKIEEDEVAEGETVGENRTKSQLKEANKELFNGLFKVFERESKRAEMALHVLVIEEGGKELAKRLKASEVTEIMICNFEIHSFANNRKSSKIKFEKYDFAKFMETFLNNAIL